MKLAAIALLIYSALVLGGGLVAFVSLKSMGSLVASVIMSVILLYLSYRVFKGALPAGYLGGVFTFLLAIYFAYRFIATERFVPNGILLIVSFAALFAVTLGVFLGLQKHS